MNPKNIILKSLKGSLISIKKHKYLFLLLIVFQIIFIISISFVQLKYQIKIIENSQNILGYFEQMNLDENAIAENLLEQKDILGEDPLLIYKKFKELINDIIIIISLTAGLILFFNTINWSMTELIFNKPKIKEFFLHSLKLFLLNIFYLLLLGLAIFLIFRKSYLGLITKNGFFLLIAVFAILVILYFMLISFSLANQRLKEIPKKTFFIGIKKAHYMLIIYLINLIILIGLGLLLLIIQDKAFILLALISIIFFASFVFCRLFLINAVRELAKV